MKLLDDLVYSLSGIAVIALGLGYLGQYHPFFDSVGILRLHVLTCLGFAITYLLLRRRWRGGVIIGLVLLLGFGTMTPYFLWKDVVRINTLLQSNILFTNDGQQLVSYINETQPSIITLQEVTSRALPNLQVLENYPTRRFCDFGSSGVMILAHYPEIPGTSGCLERQRMVWTRVITREGEELTLVSLHLFWPWPNGQPAQIDKLVAILETLERPIIIGGDFNNVAWSHAMHRIEQASGSEAIRGTRLTFDVYKGFGRFPIDHVLVPSATGMAKKGPTLGSDHNSLWVSLPDFQ